MKEKDIYERYHRQLILEGFGEAAQHRLLHSKILVVGAGGLGCPALLYLAAAGTGTLGIVDDDVVELSNLHRQPLYKVADIGQNKSARAARVLKELNPGIQSIVYEERLTVQNALDIIGDFDLIIDGTDNFSTRYMINDACVLLQKPLVYGAISQFEGQLSLFINQAEGDINYRDIFPDPPREGEVLNCAEAGVLGVLPGIIGTMMANEAIKYITGTGETMAGRLLTFNALTNQVYQMSLIARPETRSLIPENRAAFLKTDYEWLCAAPTGGLEISTEEFDQLKATSDIVVIDVREKGERPVVMEFEHEQIPLSVFRENISGIKQKSVIVFCQTGKRSLQAARWLFDTFGESKKIYSLRGGILQWKKTGQASAYE